MRRTQNAIRMTMGLALVLGAFGCADDPTAPAGPELEPVRDEAGGSVLPPECFLINGQIYCIGTRSDSAP